MTISTASTTQKAEQARAAGYEHVIDLSNESIEDGVLRITDGKGVDVVVDGVSGNLTGQALASLAFGGTVVVVGYAGGRQAEVSITDIIWKGATIRGFTFRLFKPETVAAAREVLLGYLKAGDLQPTIAKVFPLSDAPEAVRHLVEDRPFGRVLMRVGSTDEHKSVAPDLFTAETPLGTYQGLTDQVVLSKTPGSFRTVLVPRGSSKPESLDKEAK